MQKSTWPPSTTHGEGKHADRRSPALTPILALEAGPPMVAGVVYHARHSGSIDTFAATLDGYTVLMLVLQLRLAPMYARLSFAPASGRLHSPPLQ